MLRDARERYTVAQGIPVVEVIQPAVRRAVTASRNRRIGVIGTSATVDSRAYEDTFAAAPHLDIHVAACPRFVDFVEQGITSSPELLACAEDYLAPLKLADVDTLVLGCTHYPLLTGALSYVMGESVTLVSSAEETAKDLFRELTEHDLLRGDQDPAAEHLFLSTGDPASFRALARRFLGPEVDSVRHLTSLGETQPPGVIPSVPDVMLSRAPRAEPMGAPAESAAPRSLSAGAETM